MAFLVRQAARCQILDRRKNIVINCQSRAHFKAPRRLYSVVQSTMDEQVRVSLRLDRAVGRKQALLSDSDLAELLIKLSV